MSSVTNTGKIAPYAPLANGPLPKPVGMRGTLIQTISRQSVPAAAMCFVVFGSVLVSILRLQAIAINVFQTKSIYLKA